MIPSLFSVIRSEWYPLIFTMIMYAPPALSLGGLTLIGMAFRFEKIAWNEFIFGVGLVILVLDIFFEFVTFGGGSILGAFFVGITILIGAGVACIAMLFYVPKPRNLISPLLFVAVPIAMFLLFQFGMQFTPEQVNERNTITIANALEHYRKRNMRYPKELKALVPKYLSALPENPETNYGWLYKTTGTEFTLGYACRIDKYFVDFCVYDQEKKVLSTVEMRFYDPGATPVFEIGPTPYR